MDKIHNFIIVRFKMFKSNNCFFLVIVLHFLSEHVALRSCRPSSSSALPCTPSSPDRISCLRLTDISKPPQGPSPLTDTGILTGTGSEEARDSNVFNWSQWLCFLPSLFKTSRKDEPPQSHPGYSFLLSLCPCDVT